MKDKRELSEYTDEELYRLTARGSESAFSELASRYEKFVFTVANDVLRSREDAADAAQEALLKLWRTSRAWRGDCTVRTWLYRIAKTAALDMARARASRASVPFDGAFADEADTAPTPDEEAERRETADEVRAAVASLPEQFREVIIMREFSGMSYKEIADAAGIDIGTVKSRLSRARAELYEKLKDRFGKDGTKDGHSPSNMRGTK